MADVIRSVIPDEPGAMAKLTSILAEKGVQVEGINVLPKGREGQVQFLVTDGDRCLDALEEAGFSGTREDVHVLTLSNDRHAFADVCRRLAKAGINIESCFGTRYGKQGNFVLITDDNAEARRVLDQTQV
jgi:hypothetical protein